MNERGTLILVLALVGACGPSYGGQGAKTPEERIAEEERLAEEQEKESKANKPYIEAEETDAEKKAKFDKKQADLELKRAARSAETCPGSVPEAGPAGTAKVSLTFKNDGHVKEGATISSPFEGESGVGKCILKAFTSVIVPSFDGPEETVEWEVEVKAKEKEEPKPGTKKPAGKK